MAEEDCVDGYAVGFREELHDAVRDGVEFRRDDRELLVRIHDIRQRAAESLGEGFVEGCFVAVVVEIDLLEFLKAEVLHPGSVVERLGDNVTRSPVAFELQDMDAPIGIES